jgi:steroid delta-isomerase-like uncharacterized protein
MPMSQSRAEAVGQKYTDAWNSHDPNAVAAFFAEDGRIAINAGEPSIGRAGVAAMAQGFFAGFPDLIVRMDSIRTSGTHCVYMWRLTGTNTGPEGSGRRVDISGWEYWRLNDNGMIAESAGHFDAEDYERQRIGG